MRSILKLLALVCLMSASALSQEAIHQVKVGPSADKTRVLIAFAEPVSEGYKLQSMIIDVNPVKSDKEEPTSFQVDLTSTVRSVSTGEKRQKILILRWKKVEEIELRCDGKWVKQENLGAAIKTIVETTRGVTQSVPLNTKKLKDVTLPSEVEQKVSSIFNLLDTENIPCLRSLN